VIRTLIVDDDFRVARLHAEVASQVPELHVVAVTHTASAALDAAARHRPELVLLDLYLPDASGLKVLGRMRALSEPPDVIVLSAAQDMASVRSAMRQGALHFLIKPFGLDVLRDRLERYAQLHARRSVEREIDQAEIDLLFGVMRQGRELRLGLPKGHSPVTAELVVRALTEAGSPLSAADVAERVGISRATAQRYLSAMADSGTVQLRLRYGATGRPEHRYELESLGASRRLADSPALRRPGPGRPRAQGSR
jgi:response regulator of citrate/malate metabolism